MKNFFTYILLFVTFYLRAQVPQGINYQGVARDAGGISLKNQAIGIKFSVHQSSASGTIVYEETHNNMTSPLGLFTCTIGLGAQVGTNTFPSINWATGIYFIETWIDPAGGTSYSSSGTQQLMSVPYALYAENANNVNTYSLVAGANTATLVQNGTTDVGTINFASTPNTTINAGGLGNVSIIQNTTNNFTIDAPTYSISNGASTNTIVLNNGVHSSSIVIPSGISYTSGSGIAISSGSIINTAPNQTVNITGASVTGSYPNYVIASSTGSTTVLTASTNINISGTAPSYTISAPTYSLGSSSNTITLFQNGTSISSATIPLQPLPILTLNGTILQSGPNTNSVSLLPLITWTNNAGVLSPINPTYSLALGTTSTFDKFEIDHTSNGTIGSVSAHLHLKQIGADNFSRLKFSNTSAPNKFWINSVIANPSSDGLTGSGYNVYFHNGNKGHNIFTVAGDGGVYINPFNTLPASLLNIKGNLEVDSVFQMTPPASMPSNSSLGSGKIYFDNLSNKFKVSENGLAYVDLLNLPSPSPWSYNPGVLYPTFNPSTDKVAIGSAFANSMLDIQNSAISSVSINPIVNVTNFNSSFVSSVLTLSSSIGNPTSLISAIGSLSNSAVFINNYGDGSALRATNNSPSSPTLLIKNTSTIPSAVAGLFEGGVISKATSNSNYAFQVQNSSSTNLLNVLPNGNVGVGLSNPTYKFTVLDNSTGSAVWVRNDGIGAAVEAISGTSSSVALVVTNGHVKATGAPTTVSLLASTSASIVSPTFFGSFNDVKGKVLLNFTSGSILISNTIDIRVQFNKSYSLPPTILITPSTLNLNFYLVSVSTTDFVVRFVNNTSSIISGISNFEFNYFVIE